MLTAPDTAALAGHPEYDRPARVLVFESEVRSRHFASPVDETGFATTTSVALPQEKRESAPERDTDFSIRVSSLS